MNTPNNKAKDYMLDTVTLKLKYPDFRVTNPSFFTPAFSPQNYNSNFAYGHNKYEKYKQNMTSEDKKVNNYKPSLTGYQRFENNMPIYFLHIRFSIPKLIFRQSLQELSNDDFSRVVSTLKTQLQFMGIEATETTLRKAMVIEAHFGKNIPLPSPLTAQDAIAELYKADVGKSKAINMRHYENGGQALYFYASSYNIIFYDKLKEMEEPKNRAVEKDKLKFEKELIRTSDFEQDILRFEVRLTKQPSLNAFLTKALSRKISGIVFEEIFDQELCKKAVLQSWQEIIGGSASQLALKMDRPPEEIFDAMINSYISTGKRKAHSLNKLLQDFALYTLVNKCGARKIRDKIEKNWTPKSWNRMHVKLDRTLENLKDLPTDHIVSDIQIALDKFERHNWKPKPTYNPSIDFH
ncbi:MAG: hypothetical protein KGI50_01520 [Patescibacteria group bacterium]|nr:hypothetical protein [Patescibacteria group bacterium]MDE2437978.1 hypothetical protein [Patescibacteria group bacterium]